MLYFFSKFVLIQINDQTLLIEGIINYKKQSNKKIIVLTTEKCS